MEQQVSAPSVVPSAEIPVSSAPEHADLEVRPFASHEVLGGAIPAGAVALTWIRARPGQDAALRADSRPGLLIVLQGNADFVDGNDVRRSVEKGDVITVPSDSPYAFRAVGPAGLQAIHAVFRKGPEKAERGASSFEELIAYNETRVAESLAGPYFRMLRDGSLGPERCRARFRDAARVFSDAFQVMMFARQATCRDEDYGPTFLSHLREELGHNELLSVPANRRAPGDAVLVATSNWFCHQMLMLDNIEKAVLIHLVVETAGYHFHTLASPVLASDVSGHYFAAHSEADDDHKDSVLDQLKGLNPRTYRRLQQVVADGWNMFDAMTRRIVRLVELEGASS
jgi:mannose-6-phosphate isomerase-like protein (cupin superfamily)